MESFLFFSLPLRVPLAFEIACRVPVCLSRMLSGFSILLGLLPLLAFSPSGSSCSTVGWTCCGFSCLFRLLSPDPPSLAYPGCVLSHMPFHLSWLLRLSGRSVPSLGGILSLCCGFLLLLASPLSCLGSLSGFFTRFFVCRRWSAFFLGSDLLLPGFILPLGLFSFASPGAPQYRSVLAFGSPASFPWGCLLSGCRPLLSLSLVCSVPLQCPFLL